MSGEREKKKELRRQEPFLKKKIKEKEKKQTKGTETSKGGCNVGGWGGGVLQYILSDINSGADDQNFFFSFLKKK